MSRNSFYGYNLIVKTIMASVLFLLVVFLSSARPTHADSFDAGETDKLAHMAAAYGLSLTGSTYLQTLGAPRWQAVLISSLATLAVGTAKELILDDSHSAGDQVANLIGVTTQAAVVFTFEL